MATSDFGGGATGVPVQLTVLRSAAAASARGALVRRVTRVLLGLGAHLHGEAVALGAVRGEHGRVEVIECTLAPGVAHVMPRVLATEFRVAYSEVRPGAYRVSPLGPAHLPGASVHVDVVPHTLGGQHHSAGPLTIRAAAAPPAFDFEALSLSPSRVYVRSFSEAPEGLAGVFQTDQILGAMARVRDRRFRLAGGAMSAAAHGAAMCRAARIVLDDGWHMEAPAGGGSWVVARWAVLRCRPGSVRMHPHAHALCDEQDQGLAASARAHAHAHAHAPLYRPAQDPPSGPRASAPAFSSRDTLCPICHDAFHDSDVVVNLPCGHNMHAVCNRSGRVPSGLCAWLAAEQSTCPCCRSPVSADIL